MSILPIMWLSYRYFPPLGLLLLSPRTVAILVRICAIGTLMFFFHKIQRHRTGTHIVFGKIQRCRGIPMPGFVIIFSIIHNTGRAAPTAPYNCATLFTILFRWRQ
uniref:Uncharacterized protein n=1 Tax=Panstrongylus lignarius TaxID=156445 RepID=A0A224Y2L6_9HEMI